MQLMVVFPQLLGSPSRISHLSATYQPPARPPERLCVRLPGTHRLPCSLPVLRLNEDDEKVLEVPDSVGMRDKRLEREKERGDAAEARVKLAVEELAAIVAVDNGKAASGDLKVLDDLEQVDQPAWGPDGDNVVMNVVRQRRYKGT